MSVRQQINETSGLFFITFTCYKWLYLFDITNSYDAIYKWFDYLKNEHHYITGYVIMPNHIHSMIAFSNTGKNINRIIGNGKRFLAYEIVNRLKLANEHALLKKLSEAVEPVDRKRGKSHEIFEDSFDAKECITEKFINQKLNYIHNNPCSGKWDLAASPELYPHSSAKFYLTNHQGVYAVTNVAELYDIDLTIGSL